MTPALKQLKRECTLDQRLLVEKVESLLEEEMTKLEKRKNEVELDEKWITFLQEKVMDWFCGHRDYYGFGNYFSAERRRSWREEFQRMQERTDNV